MTKSNLSYHFVADKLRDHFKSTTIRTISMYRNIFLVILLVVVTGCRHIPKQELFEYTQAFQEVSKLSEEILLDFDQVLTKSREITEKKNSRNPNPNPSKVETFEEFRARTNSAPPNDIEVRRLALQTIAKYNGILTKLAEGKSVDKIKKSSGDLVNTMGKLVEVASGSGVPGLGAIVSTVQMFSEQLEKARLREEFIKAVQEGSGVVFKILEVFQEDVKQHFVLHGGISKKKQLLIVNDMTINTRVIRDYVASHAPIETANLTPDDAKKALKAANKSLETVTKELNSSLEPAKDDLQFYPIVLKFGKNQPKFNRNEIEQSLLTIKQLSKVYVDYAKQTSLIGKALIQYSDLLEKTKSNLNNLKDSIDKPQDFNAASEEVFKIIFNAKRQLEAYKAARNSTP